MIQGDTGMPGREGSPGLDGNEVHDTLYLFTLYAGGVQMLQHRTKERGYKLTKLSFL